MSSISVHIAWVQAEYSECVIWCGRSTSNERSLQWMCDLMWPLYIKRKVSTVNVWSDVAALHQTKDLYSECVIWCGRSTSNERSLQWMCDLMWPLYIKRKISTVNVWSDVAALHQTKDLYSECVIWCGRSTSNERSLQWMCDLMWPLYIKRKISTVNVWSDVAALHQTKDLYSECVIWCGRSTSNERSLQWMCDLMWPLYIKRKISTVNVWSDVAALHQTKDLYSECVIWCGRSTSNERSLQWMCDLMWPLYIKRKISTVNVWSDVAALHQTKDLYSECVIWCGRSTSNERSLQWMCDLMWPLYIKRKISTVNVWSDVAALHQTKGLYSECVIWCGRSTSNEMSLSTHQKSLQWACGSQ